MIANGKRFNLLVIHCDSNPQILRDVMFGDKAESKGWNFGRYLEGRSRHSNDPIPLVITIGIVGNILSSVQ